MVQVLRAGALGAVGEGKQEGQGSALDPLGP